MNTRSTGQLLMETKQVISKIMEAEDYHSPEAQSARASRAKRLMVKAAMYTTAAGAYTAVQYVDVFQTSDNKVIFAVLGAAAGMLAGTTAGLGGAAVKDGVEYANFLVSKAKEKLASLTGGNKNESVETEETGDEEGTQNMIVNLRALIQYIETGNIK